MTSTQTSTDQGCAEFEGMPLFADFLRQASKTTLPGAQVTWGVSVSALMQPHALALARRMDFIPQDAKGQTFVNARTPKSPVIAWLSKSDFPAWLTLFECCFGHSMPRAQWDWKYRDAVNPGIGVWCEGQLIAFYGGMPRDIWWMGEPQTALQMCDVMVHPEHKSLSRKGPFQLVTSTFLEQSLSKGAPYWAGFGFPNHRHMLVASKLGLYEPVDQIAQLSWQAQASGWPWWLDLSEVKPHELGFLDTLWAQMAQAFSNSVLGRRDQAYVQIRYMSHPTIAYKVMRLRHKVWRHDLGCLVVRPHADHRLEVMDWIGPPKNFSQLVKAARLSAAQLGCTEAYTWITESHENLLLDPDTSRELLDVVIPSNSWVEGNTPEAPMKKWWLTSGDTDFK
jgi:hypothetical protein